MTNIDMTKEDEGLINETLGIKNSTNKDMDFLPDDYQIPVEAGNYMKFKDDENIFRVLSSPILGYEYWIDTEDGKRQPIRKTMTEIIDISKVPDPSEIKHFWALVVYNYKASYNSVKKEYIGKVQILEITQKSIQKTMRALAGNPKWGNPRDYDLVVSKTGQKLETRYTVTPDPKAPLDPKIKKQYESMTINLEALFEGLDPFEQK